MLVIVLRLERKHEVLVTSDLHTDMECSPVVLLSSAPSERLLHPGACLFTLPPRPAAELTLYLSSSKPPS